MWTSARFEADALRDVLTGLPNRRLLGERLDHSASQASRADAAAAVLFVDLDEFKTVNDTHGHEMGDTVLIAVARRLSGLVRPGDTLARLSGDEFVFLCENLATVDAAEMLADRVRDAFATAFICRGVEILLSASVGVAYAGAGTLVASTLIREADLAMYREKTARAAKPPEVHSLDLTRPIPATKRG
jgi:diguanylate cyclase (GGDEF)-like protein